MPNPTTPLPFAEIKEAVRRVDEREDHSEEGQYCPDVDLELIYHHAPALIAAAERGERFEKACMGILDAEIAAWKFPDPTVGARIAANALEEVRSKIRALVEEKEAGGE